MIGNGGPRIGWLPFDDPYLHIDISKTDTYIRMRYKNIADALALQSFGHHEIYRDDQSYDAVVFLKSGLRQIERFEKIASELKKRHIPFLYDLNVNYLEVWGEFIEDYLRPTSAHIAHAFAMFDMADGVVADSGYLGQVAAKYHANVNVVPDNVNLKHHRYTKIHRNSSEDLVVGWCGVSVKSYHLKSIEKVLKKIYDCRKVHYLFISDGQLKYPPDVPYELRIFNYDRFPKDIFECDICISPKVLNNSYEFGHTEFKITTFMAQSVPPVVSPQPSYVEAVRHGQNGYLVYTDEEWETHIKALIDDPALRNRMGLAAANMVRERYASFVVAKRYASALQSIL